MTTALVWALWVAGGGSVNSGYLKQTYVAAYFSTQADCERTQKLIVAGKMTLWSQCIQATYVIR